MKNKLLNWIISCLFTTFFFTVCEQQIKENNKEVPQHVSVKGQKSLKSVRTRDIIRKNAPRYKMPPTHIFSTQ